MAYASKYYDPVKAHEYYEKHKKLKGRKSTAGLNSTGKEAAKYVKDKLQEERNAKIDSLKQSTMKEIDEYKEHIEGLKEANKRMREEYKRKKDALKQEAERIKNMPKGPAKDRAKEALKKKREKLKAENPKHSIEQNLKIAKACREDVKKLRKTFTESKKKIKADYDDKYVQELDKLKADSWMQAKKKKG